MNINKNLFYQVIILYPCKEEPFSSITVVKFETCSDLIRWDFRKNVLLIPLKYNNNNNNNNNKICSTNVYMCVYGLTWLFLVRRQGWPRSSLRMPSHPQVEWQATPRTICDTQTLAVLHVTYWIIAKPMC